MSSSQPLRSFLPGAAVEFELPRRFSFEAGFLYVRAVRNVRQSIVDDQLQPLVFKYTSSSANWEFPLLARYRLRSGSWTPVLELGPAFRIAGGGWNLPEAGLAAGAALEFRAGPLRFGPRLRYTRWGLDPARSARAGSYPNQLALLLSLSF